MAMNPGDGNPRSPDDTRLASAGTPPASPPSTLAPPVDVLLATDKGGGADCFFTPSSRSPAEGDAFSSSLGSLSFSHSAPPMPGARAETTADLQGQEQEQEPCQVGPQQQEFHHHHQQQQQRTPFPPVPWAEQREGGGGSGGRKEAMGIPRARGAQERSEVAVLGGPAEEASGWMLYLEHNSVLQQQAPDMQACVLIKRARDREHLFRGTMPAMMLKSPHCYDLQVRFCGVDQRLVMNSILRVSLFERDGTLVTAAFCDSDGEPILSDQTTSYVLQQGNGKVYGSTRLRFNTTSYRHQGSTFFLQLTMSDMLGNLLAFLVSSLFVLRAKQPVGEGGARPMGRKSNSGVGGLSPSFELGKEAARTSPEGVSPLASLANSHKRAASPPVVLRASGVLEAGDPPAWKARHRSCLPTQRSQELVAFARSLPAAERRVLRAQLVLAEFADILRG